MRRKLITGFLIFLHQQTPGGTKGSAGGEKRRGARAGTAGENLAGVVVANSYVSPCTFCMISFLFGVETVAGI